MSALVPVVLAAVLTFASLGDSLTAGRFASASCTNGTTAAVAPCAGGTTYVDVLARTLAATGPVRYQNLARGGAHTNLVAIEQAARIDPAAHLVTLFAGWTDELPIARGAYALATWMEDYDWAVAAIHARVPHARVILATLPNAAFSPAYAPGGLAALSRTLRRDAARAAVAMNAHIASLGERIIDLRCAAEFYDPRQLHPDDDVHFDDAGYAWLGRRFARAVTGAPEPRDAVCPPYSSVPEIDGWWLPFTIPAGGAG